MIEKRTVFILGAGASAPYGFPTGPGLFNEVTTQLTQPHAISALDDHCGFSAKAIEDFRLTLRHSGQTSVDAFLEHRTDLIEIGKAAMAVVLIRNENGIPMLFNNFTGAWLPEIYGRMRSKFDDFKNNKVAFLTFNYDRVLEQFLFTSLSNSHGKSNDSSIDECRAQVEAIPIIHLHGNLGDLPWQTPKSSGSKSRPFEPTVSKASLDTARTGIKIIHEAMEAGGDKDFETAKKHLKGAEQIIFLGFGYNTTNMDRLDLEHTQVPAIGTGHGMTTQEINRTMTNMKRSMTLTGYDCIALLRNVDW